MSTASRPESSDAARRISPSDRSGRWVAVGLILASIAVFAAARAPYVSLPLERDEGEYAYIAQRILHGDVPYRDAFDQKPPGIFAAYLIGFGIFGRSIEAIHLFLYVWTAATALALGAFVRRLSGDLPAAFAVLGFAAASASPVIVATAANTELFMLLPLVAAAYCLLRGIEGGAARWWVACGVMSVLACWFKQVAALNALFVGGYAVAHAARRGPRAAASVAGWIGLGVALGTLPVLGLFAALGAFGPFFDAVVVHNFRYASQVPLDVGLHALIHYLGKQAPSFVVLWTAAGVAILMQRLMTPARWWLIVGWTGASLLGVASGLYFRPHYFVQGLPGLCALAGVALGSGVNSLRARSGVLPAGLVAAALAVALVAPFFVATRDIAGAGPPAAISRAIYGDNPFPEAIRIARHIQRTSGPDDTVFIVGSEPQILFYSERRSATRYIFFYPLTGPYRDALERQREVVREVRAQRPLYVVWVNLDASLQTREWTERHVFRASAEWLQRDYRLELIARPAGDLEEFEFVYGFRGQNVLDQTEGDLAANPWIALFRRQD